MSYSAHCTLCTQIMRLFASMPYMIIGLLEKAILLDIFVGEKQSSFLLVVVWHGVTI